MEWIIRRFMCFIFIAGLCVNKIAVHYNVPY